MSVQFGKTTQAFKMAERLWLSHIYIYIYIFMQQIIYIYTHIHISTHKYHINATYGATGCRRGSICVTMLFSILLYDITLHHIISYCDNACVGVYIYIYIYIHIHIYIYIYIYITNMCMLVYNIALHASAASRLSTWNRPSSLCEILA